MTTDTKFPGQAPREEFKMYTKTTEVYHYTETVVTDADGNEVLRQRNYDDAWYETERTEYIDADEFEADYQ